MTHNIIKVYGNSRPIGWHPVEEDYPNWKEYAKALHGCIYEVDYIEYHITDGKYDYSIAGTEDFTVERAHSLTCKWIYGWFGALNKGGYKAWEQMACWKVSKETKPSELRILAKAIMPNIIKEFSVR